ncbi:MAG: hypothetical protein ACKOXC_10065 [Aquirufa sp.]|jgi:hypothetical protein
MSKFLKKIIVHSVLSLFLPFCLIGQFDQKLVKFDFREIDGNPYGIIKLYMKNERIKVKYFASKDESGIPIMERFNDWAFSKKLVLVSSGTYYYYPNKNNRNKNTVLPVGICVDNGKVINKSTEANLGGLAMVYASGKIQVENLKNNSITIRQRNGSTTSLNLADPFDKNLFFKWAEDVRATVFQTHLFAYKNQLLIGQNANNYKDYRRFLAVCTTSSGELVHYIINLPFNSTILEGSSKAIDYLKNIENVKDIAFIINLDTGAQNTLFSYHPKTGTPLPNPNFSGTKTLKDAINLIAYYYE